MSGPRPFMPCYFSPHAYRFIDTIALCKLLVALVFAPLWKLSTCADFLRPQAMIQGDTLLWWKGAIFVPAKMKVFWEPNWGQQVHPCLHRFCGAVMAWWKAGCGRPPGYCCHCSACAFIVLASHAQCSPCSRILLQRVFVKDHCWQRRLQVNLSVRFETGRL